MQLMQILVPLSFLFFLDYLTLPYYYKVLVP